MIAQTAAEAFSRYQDFLARDALVQSSWHTERDGQQLACVLGVLGDELNGIKDCPVQVMPRWLAQHVVWFFDGQDFDDAKAWGARFYAELTRLGGAVPFRVVHDWQATVICPIAIEVAKKRDRDPAPHAAVQELHRRALGRDVAPKNEWVATLRLAYADAYAYAYATADADANADANAYAYAAANAYAADANAYACATYAAADTAADANAKRQSIKRLADGMVECMARVTV